MTLHFNYHTRWHSGDNQSVESSALVVSRWLWPGSRTFLEVASMVVSWWIVAFLCSGTSWNNVAVHEFCLYCTDVYFSSLCVWFEYIVQLKTESNCPEVLEYWVIDCMTLFGIRYPISHVILEVLINMGDIVCCLGLWMRTGHKHSKKDDFMSFYHRNKVPVIVGGVGIFLFIIFLTAIIVTVSQNNDGGKKPKPKSTDSLNRTHV